MKRQVACLSVMLATSLVCSSETTLPENDDYQSFEVEPPILLPNREVAPDKAATGNDATPSNRDPAQLEKQVERARRAAAEAEQLFKRGVLSKMEGELRALRLVRLQSELEKARLERAKADLAIQHTRYEMGEITKEAFADAQRLLQTATETAEAAAATRQRAEVAAAETNLRRQRKLAELGSARRADVIRAEQKLADVKAAGN